MTRYKDPPGDVKHLRFGTISPEIYEAIIGFPGVKSVVLHTHGAKGEHPHYHVWWERDKPCTNQNIRDRLKAMYPTIFTKENFHSQNCWSFKNHDSWETWANYVCSNMSHKVLLPYKEIEEISKLKAVPIVAINIPHTPSLSTAGPIIRMPKPSISMKAKFARHLEHEHEWKKYEEITLDNYTDKLHEAIEHLTDFWENAFTTPQGVVTVEHIVYIFGDEPVRKMLKARNQTSIIKCLR